jgi:uncharacterized membrane protein
MNKSSLSALAVLVAVTGLAAPALAASSLVDDRTDNEHFNETIVAQQLRENGVDVIDLTDWDGKIRATVRLDDGRLAFQYFQPGTLEQVAASGNGNGNVRVLSQRDLGPGARIDVPSGVPQSLVDNSDDN